MGYEGRRKKKGKRKGGRTLGVRKNREGRRKKKGRRKGGRRKDGRE